ncbi:MAG: TetR/AcrR family transcriptional regulator [Acidimicrobiales bacterium]
MKPLRADARRNRARLLEVAYEVFAAEGLGVPIDEIAQRAGVGAGTVYRHFPTKDSLFAAIVVNRVDRLVSQARTLAASGDPGQAFFDYLLLVAEEGAADMGLVEALAGTGFDIEAAAPMAEQELRDAIEGLLSRAQAAGAVREDIDVADVKTLIVGCQAMHRYRGAADMPDRLMEVVLEGLRPSPT